MSLVFDNYSLNEATRELRRGSEPVKIDPQQLDLLALFLRNSGKLLSRQQILESIWEGRSVGESVLSVAIAKLRKVLGTPQTGGEFIESRYGRGYRFMCEVKQTADEASAALPQTRLVGRSQELQQLQSAMERARIGRGRLLLLTGEAGIGKTCLAECLHEEAAQQNRALVLWARCQPDVRTPLWAVRQLMRGLREHGASAPDFAADSDTIDHGTLDAFAQALLQASQRRPLLLIVDDMQWADSASLRVFAYLADDIARAPLLLVCTLRCGGALADGVRAVSALWNHRNCQRIELQRLHAHDVAAYVEARLGQDHAELSRVLYTRSEGVPFFMVDLLRSLDPTVSADNAPLHPSQLALHAVRERLRELSTETRRVLGAAAVIGHDFDIGLLAHVTDERPAQLLDLLSAPNVSQMVHAQRGAVGAFGFDHELVREAMYEELSPQQRAQLHLYAGQGLQQRRAHGGAVTYAELAHHFLSAQPLGDIEQALDYALTAAAEASRLAAHADGRTLLRHALEVLRFRVAVRAETRVSLLLQLAMVERVLGDPTYRTNLASALSIAREHRLGRLLTFAGQLLSVSPDVVSPPEVADALLAANETLDPDDHEHLAIVRAHLAWHSPCCHSQRRVDELLQQAEALAERSGSARARGVVDETLLYFRAGPDSYEQAQQIAARIDQSTKLEPELSSHARRVHVVRFRLISAMQRGDRAGITHAIETRAALVKQLRNAEAAWHYDRMLMVKAMNEGAFEQIKPELRALRERARRLELHASQLLWSLDYGIFLCRTSDISGLAQRARRTLQPAELDSPTVRASKIRGLLNFGLIDDAAYTMSQLSLDEISDLAWSRDALAVLCHLAAGASAAQNREQCALLLQKLSPYAELYAVGVSLHNDGSVASHLGMLYEALGERARAREHYARGRERELSMGLLPCAALTGFQLARLLTSDAPEGSAGLRLLEQVRAESLRMGMQPLARAAYDLRRGASRSTAATCADTALAQPALVQCEQFLEDR